MELLNLRSVGDFKTANITKNSNPVVDADSLYGDIEGVYLSVNHPHPITSSTSQDYVQLRQNCVELGVCAEGVTGISSGS